MARRIPSSLLAGQLLALHAHLRAPALQARPGQLLDDPAHAIHAAVDVAAGQLEQPAQPGQPRASRGGPPGRGGDVRGALQQGESLGESLGGAGP